MISGACWDLWKQEKLLWLQSGLFASLGVTLVSVFSKDRSYKFGYDTFNLESPLVTGEPPPSPPSLSMPLMQPPHLAAHSSLPPLGSKVD